MKRLTCKLLVLTGVLVTPYAPSWAAYDVGPVKFSGSLGYSLRDLSASSGRDTTSNQVRGTLNTNSYLWQPWFATAALRLTGVQDMSDVDGANSTQTNLFTGNATLNVLPQSHSPFQMNYRTSDTRVDRVSLQELPVSFAAASGFNSDRIEVKQSLLTDTGHRFQVRYDNSHWGTDLGSSFDDEIFGAEADVKLVKNRLVARISQENTKNSLSAEDKDRFVINLEHDYVPSTELRVDSLFNILTEDRKTTNSVIGSNSTIDSHQISSFAFWRPDNNKPLTMSGGVRVYGIDTGAATFNSTQESISTSLGGFYQYNKNIRFDANLAASRIDIGAQDISQTQQRLGALYQSDLIYLGAREVEDGVIFPWNYQWYADSALSNQTNNRTENIAALSAAVGHNLNRTWQQTEFSFLRLGLSQLLTGFVDKNSDGNSQRLSQSGNVSWNNVDSEGGSSTVLLSLSDSRDLENNRNNQQLANLQLTHDLKLTRQSQLSGNLTFQHVRQNFDALPDSKVTSASGRASYNNNRIFGVPRLRYLSELYVSRAELSNSLDRAEWENRLSYVIGETDSELSFKWIDSGALRYTLIYFRITRNF